MKSVSVIQGVVTQDAVMKSVTIVQGVVTQTGPGEVARIWGGRKDDCLTLGQDDTTRNEIEIVTGKGTDTETKEAPLGSGEIRKGTKAVGRRLGTSEGELGTGKPDVKVSKDRKRHHERADLDRQDLDRHSRDLAWRPLDRDAWDRDALRETRKRSPPGAEVRNSDKPNLSREEWAKLQARQQKFSEGINSEKGKISLKEILRRKKHSKKKEKEKEGEKRISGLSKARTSGSKSGRKHSTKNSGHSEPRPEATASDSDADLADSEIGGSISLPSDVESDSDDAAPWRQKDKSEREQHEIEQERRAREKQEWEKRRAERRAETKKRAEEDARVEKEAYERRVMRREREQRERQRIETKPSKRWISEDSVSEEDSAVKSVLSVVKMDPHKRRTHDQVVEASSKKRKDARLLIKKLKKRKVPSPGSSSADSESDSDTSRSEEVVEPVKAKRSQEYHPRQASPTVNIIFREGGYEW